MRNWLIGLAFMPGFALAESGADTGDTAWILTATALVLFMTLPGLSFFYGGLVRSKNVLSVLMQCFAIACGASLIWLIAGYSLAFGEGNAFIGDFSNMFLANTDKSSLSGTLPEPLFFMFQMTFAIITPALMVGGFAERMKFSSVLVFSLAWLVLVYLPVCHWVWGGGWLSDHGVHDFAGGTVVHINAGVAGLVAAIVLGKRNGYPTTHMPPHNLGLTVIGASMLWVGWFGFNAGSQLAADGTAGMALAVTQLATAGAALAWMYAEWITHGKPSVLGIATGAVAGLVAITPASGSVGPMGAIAIGLLSGIGCFYAATRLKRSFGYDDSLDVFGVHAVGGIIGAVLTGIFCAEGLGGVGFGGDNTSIPDQLKAQIIGVVATIVYSGVVSFIILKAVDAVIGLRVTEDEEAEGLDLAQHDERGYIL